MHSPRPRLGVGMGQTHAPATLSLVLARLCARAYYTKVTAMPKARDRRQAILPYAEGSRLSLQRTLGLWSIALGFGVYIERSTTRSDHDAQVFQCRDNDIGTGQRGRRVSAADPDYTHPCRSRGFEPSRCILDNDAL